MFIFKRLIGIKTKKSKLTDEKLKLLSKYAPHLFIKAKLLIDIDSLQQFHEPYQAN
jgi:hypothetical protein